MIRNEEDCTPSYAALAGTASEVSAAGTAEFEVSLHAAASAMVSSESGSAAGPADWLAGTVSEAPAAGTAEFEVSLHTAASAMVSSESDRTARAGSSPGA